MKEKEKKTNPMKTIKILTISLVVFLISMISFIGIYIQNKNAVENKVKDYSYSMSLNGARTIKLKVNSEETEGLTIENYKKSTEIIEKRLKKAGVEEYKISLNETTGDITVEILENTATDKVVSNLNTTGKFEIVDSETQEVLLDNSKIKSSDVLYNTTSSGTSIYLQIAFNKEGKEKLKEVTQTYVSSANNTTTNTVTDNTANEITENSKAETTEGTTNTISESETETSTEKKITMKIDGEEIMSTSFDEPITTGKIQLSVGSATTDSNTIQDYATQAQNIATVLDSGNLPIKYNIEKNQYILSEITNNELIKIKIAVAIVAIIGILLLIFKYKTNGLLAGISYIGLVALYMLLVRYTNVKISIESILGIIIVFILNYLFTNMLLKKVTEFTKESEENPVGKATIEIYKKFFLRIIPICIISIVFCFIKWVPISSFGMITFWGITIIAIYNAIITRTLLKIKAEK